MHATIEVHLAELEARLKTLDAQIKERTSKLKEVEGLVTLAEQDAKAKVERIGLQTLGHERQLTEKRQALTQEVEALTTKVAGLHQAIADAHAKREADHDTRVQERQGTLTALDAQIAMKSRHLATIEEYRQKIRTLMEE